jgi:hypothetical protein
MNREGKEQGFGKGVTRQLHNVTGIDERVMVSDRVTRSDPYNKIEGGGVLKFIMVQEETTE